jgi:hypothetical protein
LVLQALLRLNQPIEIGEFVAASGYDSKGFAELMAARGTAKHRLDGKDVTSEALLAARSGENKGLLIVGAWKNESSEELVKKTLRSLHIEQ